MLKKFLKVLGIVLSALIIGVNLYAVISGKTYFYKALKYNLANVDDYKIFDNRKITRSKKPQSWPVAESFNKKELSPDLKANLKNYKTFAFLIIKNDSIVHEEYNNGYGPSSYSNSFSAAKSIISVLTGIALYEGRIKSLDEPVGNYIEDFKLDGKDKVTIRHLLMMSSGLNWDESYASPFSMTTEAYYGHDLPYLMSRMKLIEEPGKYFKYLSGNSQLLAMILEKATGKRVSLYAQEKLWEPLGMENDALWSLDKPDGLEKAYCCVNSNARDLAKIGSLYLHKGNWKGFQILDSNYVKESITQVPVLNTVDSSPVDFYGLHWWLIPKTCNVKAFYARGIQGQYIIVIPDKNMVIVRLGEGRGKKVGVEQLEDVLLYTNEICNIF